MRDWWSVQPETIQRSALACVLPLELSVQSFSKLLRALALQQAPLGPEDPRAVAGVGLASPGGKQGSPGLLTSADSPPSAQPGALPPPGVCPWEPQMHNAPNSSHRPSPSTVSPSTLSF